MRLQLGYGQDRPDGQAIDLGFDGPTLSGVESIESTYYATTITVRFHDDESFENARRTTGWTPYIDSARTLEAETLGPFVVTREPERHLARAYYANLWLVDDKFIVQQARMQLDELAYSLARARAGLD